MTAGFKPFFGELSRIQVRASPDRAIRHHRLVAVLIGSRLESVLRNRSGNDGNRAFRVAAHIDQDDRSIIQ